MKYHIKIIAVHYSEGPLTLTSNLTLSLTLTFGIVDLWNNRSVSIHFNFKRCVWPLTRILNMPLFFWDFDISDDDDDDDDASDSDRRSDNTMLHTMMCSGQKGETRSKGSRERARGQCTAAISQAVSCLFVTDNSVVV